MVFWIVTLQSCSWTWTF